MVRRRRVRVEPTDEWSQLELLLKWPEQREYELIRPIVVFGSSVAERARETGTASESTLRRKSNRFDEEGMPSLLGSEPAKHHKLPPAMRRLIVDRKAEYPPFSLGELARICYVAFGRRPSKHTVKRVLHEGPTPLMPVRRYPPYHEIPNGRKRREAVVELHTDGWTVKSIAGFLKTSETTVYRTLKRWVEEGVEGLEDRPRGRPRGSGKVNFPIMNTVRRMQDNPRLGAFRVHAALKQMGIHLSRATCGRIMAENRKVYGLGKPRGGAQAAPKQMPFASERLHEYWSADIRYIDTPKLSPGGQVYAVSVLENHSRAILSSGVFRTQNLSSFLSVFYQAIERYGSPGALVTDSGSVFRATRAKAIYEALGIEKEEIERGQPWQNFSETTFAIQERMADHFFEKAESWAELVEAHDRWVQDYNWQVHSAHLGRKDGKHSPMEVLGWLTEVRYRTEDLRRAFFSSRFTRVLDDLGYARFRHWRLYGEEGLAKEEATLWLEAESLTLEHRGQPLSRYEVRFAAGDEELRSITRPRLFETSYMPPQLRLFRLEVLGETGWLKAMKLDGYAPRQTRPSEMLQQSLFAYVEAL
ncbi:MAG: helix-turn-helix domain-containing protein [Actinomycetota bacterium]